MLVSDLYANTTKVESYYLLATDFFIESDV